MPSNLSADTRRLDWFNAARPDVSNVPVGSEPGGWHFVVEDPAYDGDGFEHADIRAAIDHAMTAAPAAPEGK